MRSLGEWLAWMEANHPRQIELGLGRIADVAARLALPPLARRVITVGGTNGKGSCVAALQAMLIEAGLQVGCYTSPHLLHYNERVRIGGRPVSDAELVQAFEAVYAALGEISLTYFEFGTLAAFWLFARQPLDVVVLEVGLGGRLDAVNLIDADVAVLTAVALIGGIVLGIWSLSVPDTNPSEQAVRAGLAWWTSIALVVGTIAGVGMMVLSGVRAMLRRR